MRLAHKTGLALVVLAAGLFAAVPARAQAPASAWHDLSDLNGPAYPRPSGAMPDRAMGANPTFPPGAFPDLILGVYSPFALDWVGLTAAWDQSAGLWMTDLGEMRPLGRSDTVTFGSFPFAGVAQGQP